MLRPYYGPTGCPSCRFIRHSGGADWYYCPIAPPGNLIARHSSEPHDIEVRSLATPPKAGPWKRALDLAVTNGLTQP